MRNRIRTHTVNIPDDALARIDRRMHRGVIRSANMHHTSRVAPYRSFGDFLFEEPLYGIVQRPTPEQVAADNFQKVQGYCPECKQERAFTCIGDLNVPRHWQTLSRNPASVQLRCLWNDKHHMSFFIQFQQTTMQKIGQLPSFATIAQGENKEFRKLMTSQDAAEFAKAIGLASHDTGIGAFIYVRRIFERVIRKCFDEHKDENGWTEEQYKARMDDRILFMASHLPPFIVENRKLYGILSQAVHELDEDKCLSFFPVARDSIIQILREEKRQREERASRKQLQAEIAKFQTAKD